MNESEGNWIELKLIGTKSNRDAIGASIRVEAGGLVQIREIDGGNGYAGQSSRRAHFGLGKASKIDRIEIKWPSGRVETATVPINRITYIHEGRGVTGR